jgi:hypothetical protein
LDREFGIVAPHIDGRAAIAQKPGDLDKLTNLAAAIVHPGQEVWLVERSWRCNGGAP